jgi:hypothetical protein
MSATSYKLAKLFEPELKNIAIFFGGREDIEYLPLTEAEVAAVDKSIDQGLNVLRRVSPTIAANFEMHRTFFQKCAGIAKAKFPGQKTVQYPSQAGGIGAALLFPQALKYAATPSATSPCYTSYTTNSWDISLTAGTAAYILGDGTNFYKASPTTEAHSLVAICHNGLLEIGSTPRIIQHRIWTQAETKYGIWATQPLAEIPIEPNKVLYQYNTIGALILTHDFGVMWKILPKSSGTSTLPLLGMVFYEHDFAPDTKWVA